jgi:hypothetical protein
MITAMYHAKKEVGNSKSDMPTKIGISFFEMPFILQRIDSASQCALQKVPNNHF